MSSFILKSLACIFMLIDHIGFVLFPKIALLRAIGRLSFPIFSFQVSIGYEKTRSKESYILRMILFTILSQIPYYLIRQAALTDNKPMLNVGATITLGLLAIYSFEKIKKPFLKYFSICFIILVSIFVPMDYGWYGVLMILFFHIYRNDKLAIVIYYSVLVILYCNLKQSIFNLPALLALLPILLYNGKKGKDMKYFFYAFYPLHLLLLTVIKHFYF